MKVELWPGGREAEAVEVGRAVIANLSGLAECSDYAVVARDDHGIGVQRIVRRHHRSKGFWPLLARAFAPGAPGSLPTRWRETGRMLAARAGIPGAS